MAKAVKKKIRPKKKEPQITGSFDDVISASVRNVGHAPKKGKK